MSQDDLESLPDGEYRAYIDQILLMEPWKCLKPVLVGEMNKKSCSQLMYVIHQWLITNQVSVLASALMSYIKTNYPDNKMSYRFAFFT